MNAKRFVLGSLAVFGLVLVGSAITAGDNGKNWTVIIKKVEVMKTNADGNAWDVNNGKPDLAVIIRNMSVKDSAPYETKEKTDTFTAEFNEPTKIRFQPGQTLQFEVIDRDIAANDSIGKINHECEAGKLKEGSLMLEKFGRVVHLEVELKKQ